MGISLYTRFVLHRTNRREWLHCLHKGNGLSAWAIWNSRFTSLNLRLAEVPFFFVLWKHYLSVSATECNPWYCWIRLHFNQYNWKKIMHVLVCVCVLRAQLFPHWHTLLLYLKNSFFLNHNPLYDILWKENLDNVYLFESNIQIILTVPIGNIDSIFFYWIIFCHSYLKPSSMKGSPK